MDNESRVEAIEEMLVNYKSETLLIKSFAIYGIGKRNVVSRIVIIMLSIFLAFIISSADTIPVIMGVLEMLLDSLLALFGVVFTGYALFQALLSGHLVAELMEDIKENTKTHKKNNTLYELNWSFMQLMMQFIILILITLFIKALLYCMPEAFILFQNVRIDVILSTAMLALYFYVVFVCLWRMISFIFNVYQLFNTYAVTKYISFVKQGSKE